MIPLDVLRLDLDRKFTFCGWSNLCERIRQVLELSGLRVAVVEVRQTKKGFHVVLQLEAPLTGALQLVALQAALGSDGVREALNLRRALSGRADDWNILFQEKDGNPPTKPRIDYAAQLIAALRKGGQRPRLETHRLLTAVPA